MVKERKELETARAVKNFPERSLRDLYYVIFRQKRKIVLFFTAVMVATILGTFLAPKTYQSEGKLMVRLGRESVTLDPTATTGQVVNIGQSRESEIKSELEILQSRDLAEKVVDFIGYKEFLKTYGSPLNLAETGVLGKSPAGKGGPGKVPGQKDPETIWDRDKAVRSLLNNLETDTQKNSNIISIAYKANNPELAHAVVGKLIDFYLDKHIAVHRTAGSDEFFSQQAAGLRAKLAQTEEALRDLKNRTGVASVAEQRTILLNRIGSLQKTMEETSAAGSASESKIKAMEHTLAGLPTTLLRTKITGYSGNPIDYLQERLHDLQLKEQDLLSKFTEKSRQVQEVRRQIAEAQALLKTEDPTHGQVTRLTLLGEKAALSELQGKAQALKGELAAAQGELKDINESEIKIAKLQRELDIQSANYRSYSDKLEQARIDRALEMGKISNISVVQAATYPVKPIRPRKALNLALGLILGMFGGLGFAFMAEQMDHSFKIPDDVGKRLDLPVLGTIPHFNNRNGALLTTKQETRFVPMLFSQPSLSPDTLGMMPGYPVLVNHILSAQSGPGQVPSVIAVTSCHRGEGVSSVAANLATALARQKDGRVLLVDANFNNPSVHLIFGLPQSPGLTEIFFKGQLDASAIQPSSIKNLNILTSGKNPLDLSVLSESRHFADLLSLWKTEYSFVIFDTSALQGVPAGLSLSPLVDGVILVVEAGRTRWEVARQFIDGLDKTKSNLLGVVLNKREFPIPEWLYRTL
jgi:capsular exopolysaccharide synthesis family protein